RLRPTRAPCSVQRGTYGPGRRRARGRGAGTVQFAETSRCAARASGSCCMLQRVGPKKFTEPVALLSTSPGNLRLPPTCPRERLRPTRAPCSVQERTYSDGQGRSRPAASEIRAFCAQSFVHISTVFPGRWGKVC